jgi:hypothetical protein
MLLGASGALRPVDASAHGIGGRHTGSAALVSTNITSPGVPHVQGRQCLGTRNTNASP